MSDIIGNFSKYKDPLWYTSNCNHNGPNDIMIYALKNPLTTLKIIEDISDGKYNCFRNGSYLSKNLNITEEYLYKNYEIFELDEKLCSNLSSNLERCYFKCHFFYKKKNNKIQRFLFT